MVHSYLNEFNSGFVSGMGDDGSRHSAKDTTADTTSDAMNIQRLPVEMMHRILLELVGAGSCVAAFRPLARFSCVSKQCHAAANSAIPGANLWAALTLSMLQPGVLPGSNDEADWRTVASPARVPNANTTLRATAMVQAPRWTSAPMWHQPWRLPCERYGHSSVLWRGRLIMFGGRDSDGFHSNDLHVAELTHSPPSWSVPQTCGPCPSARRMHTATLDDDGRMYVLGGSAANWQQGISVVSSEADDCFSLDVHKWKWREERAPPADHELTCRPVLLGTPQDEEAVQRWRFFGHTTTLLPAALALAVPSEPTACHSASLR